MSQNLRPAEISSILQQEIGKYDSKLKMETVGTVLQVGDGIARVWGLDKVMSAELVEFIPTKTDGKPVEPIFGMALNLEEDHVGCVVLGDDSKIKEGDEVRTTGRITQVPVGPALIGRVVNALGQPLDNKGPIATKEYRPIEGRSPN
ncbi:MAG TPA: F0F1 ATP synthase subunit alpha, partial [Planctomycetota bacterium]|nr:F0F1 ATP synthase subunit alpha [Planctomycetota bacterium]